MGTKTRVFVVLCSVAVLLILTSPPAAAGPNVGNSPHVAHRMSGGLNVGVLAPGEVFWYVMDSDELGHHSDRMVVLNMIYRPGEHDVAPYVNFQVFGQEQVDRWLQGYPDAYTGMGTFTTTDFDQETSERLWSGDLSKSQSYYVRVFNNSTKSVEFHMMALTQTSESVSTDRTAVMVETADTTAPTVEPAASIEFAPVASTAAAPAKSFMPSQAVTVEQAQWQLVAAAVQGMSVVDAAAWLQMASQIGWLPPISQGAYSVLPTAPAAPAAYVAPVPAQPTYGLAAPAETSASMGEPAAAAVPPQTQEEAMQALFDLYPNVYPSTPMALRDGANVGKLAPGGEHWYSFIREDMDDTLFEHMAITLFSTPADGNRSHHIGFQIFDGAQIHIWERGTPKDMVPMGAGQWVSRDNDPVTGERVWSGHVVDGNTYYVRVFNNSDNVIDYYLITNDVINTELGEKVFAANPGIRNPLWQPGGQPLRNR